MSFRFIDLFCGGGGSITGAISALKNAGMPYEGRGFNHWDVAIRTIQANHPEIIPDFERACASIESVLPDEIFASDPTRIDVVWASPSCTHHSIAAGGKPKSNQLRSQPEYLLPYLRLTKCRRMFVENVKELRDWGPLLDADTSYQGKRYKAGTPDPRKKGLFFNLWYRELKASGYSVDMQVMNAADYGAATSRERLIIQCVRKSTGERIVWPEPTHQQEPGLFSDQYKPWKTAAEIIDWSIPGESIFDRAKPLCENTLKRIEAGIEKFWGEWAEPFLALMHGADSEFRVPLDCLESFLIQYNGGQPGQHIPSLAMPLPTITAHAQKYALIRPIWIDLSHTKNNGVSGTIESPLNTITCSHGTHSVVMPFISRYNGGDDRNHGIDAPIPVIDCSNRYGVVQPLFIPQQSDGSVKPVSEPLSTIATSGAIGVVNPLIVKYYGNETSAKTVGEPLDTITTKDRFGLIQGRILTLPDGQQFKLDITHRMLTASELARATSFPDDYIFCGGDTAAKKQIGNAVPPVLAEALYRAILAA